MYFYCPPVDGGWCTYSDWSDCSVTCENGTKTRSRECKCPEPAYGGATCVGATTETQYCSGLCCPVDGYLSDWLPWSSCSATCGLPGTVTRSRTKECIYPDPDCPGDDCGQLPEEYENCTQKPCCTTSGGSPGSFQHDRGNRLHGLRVNFRGANTNDKYVTFRCGIVLIESIQNYDETYVADVQAAVTDVCTEQSRRVCQVTIPAPPGCPCQVMIKYMCCNTLY
ncbi:thrombospondin-2-like [Lingula anatina]|uniref:Thrombospondin-2-like n=1 Tax=Lingula anatina TaxID=7574 RepID=A0A1S3HYQ0_LINAN|nr:thrombospondin-2-like [Lingula anatina]|eukprot:XP_013390209.1 thrombospondin-2-like [Lingula anatina]